MKHKLLTLIVLLFFLCGCEPYTEAQFHIYTFDEAYTISEFTDEQAKTVLEAFNVVIPEEEGEAYIRAFVREEDSDSRFTKIWFFLEIGGVNDYEAFYAANRSRIHENGLDGISDNELRNLSNGNFYITYIEFFYTKPRLIKDGEEKMYEALQTIYDELIWEKESGTE